MDCDIHSMVEVFDGEKWNWIKDIEFPSYGGRTTNEPFDWRSYGMFGFLAGVRNYSVVPILSKLRGIPEDISVIVDDSSFANPNKEEKYLGDHSFSYLTLKELLDFDYDSTFEDRRITIQTGQNSWNGAGLAEKEEGNNTTYREFLGENFFRDIEIMKQLHPDPTKIRIVFGFDN